MDVDRLRASLQDIDREYEQERAGRDAACELVLTHEARMDVLLEAKAAIEKVLGDGVNVTITSEPRTQTIAVPLISSTVRVGGPARTLRSAIVQALMDAHGPRDSAAIIARVKADFPASPDHSIYETLRQLAADDNSPVDRLSRNSYQYVPRSHGLNAAIGAIARAASEEGG